MSNAVLKGNASGTGTVTLETPNTNSDRTIVFPDATGTAMVSGNMPAFSVSLGTSQTPSAATWTKVNLNTENFDTNNNFASNRFTPTVAGYYQINAASYVYSNSTTMTGFSVGIYKNGTQYAVSGVFVGTAFTESVPCVSSVVYCNGSTDYIEMYVWINGTTPVIASGAITQMSGSLVRGA